MIESLKRNKVGILLMAGSSICVCLGQLLWKLSADSGFLFLAAGFFLYGVGALAMIVAYKFGKVSVLQPVLSLNYILSIILAATVLNETITLVKCIGVLLIMAGVLLIAGGDEVKDDASV
ncbi:MAG: EamA family transporter [Butyrivibrio sp.]|nr:EamA family transporter [Acetatifactor muris]MCM1558984.1 EamA family transporter [Butyrivibrio sp.]